MDLHVGWFLGLAVAKGGSGFPRFRARSWGLVNASAARQVVFERVILVLYGIAAAEVREELDQQGRPARRSEKTSQHGNRQFKQEVPHYVLIHSFLPSLNHSSEVHSLVHSFIDLQVGSFIH